MGFREICGETLPFAFIFVPCLLGTEVVISSFSFQLHRRWFLEGPG